MCRAASRTSRCFGRTRAHGLGGPAVPALCLPPVSSSLRPQVDSAAPASHMNGALSAHSPHLNLSNFSDPGDLSAALACSGAQHPGQPAPGGASRGRAHRAIQRLLRLSHAHPAVLQGNSTSWLFERARILQLLIQFEIKELPVPDLSPTPLSQGPPWA